MNQYQDGPEGNIFIRQMQLDNAGMVIEGHAHNFDHVTYVCRGSILIEELDERGETLQSIVKSALDGYNWIRIRAGKIHRITALEDRTLAHCVYAHRNPQGEVVAVYDGWTPAYC